jgi:hypothetical protein
MAGWQSRKVSGFMAKTARKGKKMGAKGKVAHTLRFSTIKEGSTPRLPAVTGGWPRLAADIWPMALSEGRDFGVSVFRWERGRWDCKFDISDLKRECRMEVIFFFRRAGAARGSQGSHFSCKCVGTNRYDCIHGCSQCLARASGSGWPGYA